MTVPLDLVRRLQGKPADAWVALGAWVLEACSKPLPGDGSHAASEVLIRDQLIGALDHYLSTAGWDLWREFQESVPRTSAELTGWWKGHPPGRAVLILDGLSLRELAPLLQEATKRGYQVEQVRVTGAEVPGDTTSFARALGLGQRSDLRNNSAGGSFHLPGAATETDGHSFHACSSFVGAQPDWVFWHEWPDTQVHALAQPGKGLRELARETVADLRGDEFWEFVGRLLTGRRLVVTSDHGYAATGSFKDEGKGLEAPLRKAFQSGRSTPIASFDAGAFVDFSPPPALALHNSHGDHACVLGRRKWKSPGGYPTLTHGGLTLLEMLVPFVEISRLGGS